MLFCWFAENKFSAWNLFKLACYGKFGFSRQGIYGNKLAKGMCFARDIEVLSSSTEGHQFFIIEIKSQSKGLSQHSNGLLLLNTLHFEVAGHFSTSSVLSVLHRFISLHRSLYSINWPNSSIGRSVLVFQEYLFLI